MLDTWVCVQPQDQPSIVLQPKLPLAQCTDCLAQKRYDDYLEAAAHLRSAHFAYPGGEHTGDWAFAGLLNDWVRKIQDPHAGPDDPSDASSGNDKGADYKPGTHDLTFVSQMGTSSVGALAAMYPPIPLPPSRSPEEPPLQRPGIAQWVPDLAGADADGYGAHSGLDSHPLSKPVDTRTWSNVRSVSLLDAFTVYGASMDSGYVSACQQKDADPAQDDQSKPVMSVEAADCDARTVYSDEGSIGRAELDTYKSELVDDLVNHVRALDAEPEVLERVFGAMPELMRSFALTLGQSGSTQAQRDVMYFVHRYRL